MPSPLQSESIHIRRARIAIILLAVGLLIYEWIVVTTRTSGDLRNHLAMGLRFLHHEHLYLGGLNYVYPPFWAMAFSTIAWLPLPLAKAIIFLLAPLSLITLVWIFAQLPRSHPDDRPTTDRPRISNFWLFTLVFLFLSRFILRDLDDAGPNLFLLTLAWLSIYLWMNHRDWLAGALLGLAIALKCTPIIFLGWFLWKRQWKLALSTLIVTTLLTLAPATVMGWTSYTHHIGLWADFASQGISSSDPSIGVLGPEPLQNKSLRPALARYLIHLPPDHPGRPDHPGYFDFLNLSPQAASWIIKILMLIGALTFAWAFRRKPNPRTHPSIPWELASICILMLLYSPVTWGQHCVALLPAVYLIAHRLFARRPLARWEIAALSLVAVLFLVTNRALLGANLSLLIESYHLTTFAIILLLVVTLREWRRASIM